MQLNRRAFIAGLIATPAIVKAGNIYVPKKKLIINNDLASFSSNTKIWLHYLDPRTGQYVRKLYGVTTEFSWNAEKDYISHLTIS